MAWNLQKWAGRYNFLARTSQGFFKHLVTWEQHRELLQTESANKFLCWINENKMQKSYKLHHDYNYKIIKIFEFYGIPFIFMPSILPSQTKVVLGNGNY